MHKIDMNTWPRAELFRFFSGVSQPFYSVTFRVDVTNLHAYTKARGISFLLCPRLSRDRCREQRGEISAIPSGTARSGFWISASPA